ncbi:MAG: hypothetical protein GY757_46545 [bacterium]|nr:hypothetical protein [bacterium]
MNKMQITTILKGDIKSMKLFSRHSIKGKKTVKDWGNNIKYKIRGICWVYIIRSTHETGGKGLQEDGYRVPARWKKSDD